jgi:hypothetical protein
MASTYSTSLKLTLIGDGDQAGIWGQTTNNNLGTLLEQAITGVQAITMADANYTLTNFNGVVNEARNAVLVVGGANNAVRDLIPPLVEKLYTVVNNTTGGYAIRVIGATGTGVTIPNGTACLVYCDGTNFLPGLSGTSGSFTVNGAVTTTGNITTSGNVTASGNITASGNATATNFIGAGATLTSINASNISSGTIANARTTASSANGASTIVARDSLGNFNGGIITGAALVGDGSNVSNINATSISSGTVATARISGSYTGITGVGNLTAGTWSANAVGAAYGGTGRTSLTAGNVILGNGTSAVSFVAPGTSGNYLRSNGSTWESAAPPGAEFSSGTRLLFQQTSAPTGWTKDTSYNEHALKITSGSVSSGGSVDFTTAFASQTPSGSVSISSISGSAGATTLSTPQIPSHSHPIFGNGGFSPTFRLRLTGDYVDTTTTSTGAAGGGGSHTHPFSFSSGSGTFSGNSVTALQNSHNHTQDAHNHTASSSFSGTAINLAVRYLDVITATKD